MIKTKTAAILALMAASFATAVLLCAQERMRAGLWDVTITNDGKQSGGLGATCYTPAMVELANMPEKMIREATEKSISKHGACTLKDFKLEGGKISMTTSCGTTSSVYSSTYSGDTFETIVTVNEAGVKKTIQMKGRRIGECK